MEERPFALTRGFFVSGDTRPLHRHSHGSAANCYQYANAAPQIVSEQRQQAPPSTVKVRTKPNTQDWRY